MSCYILIVEADAYPNNKFGFHLDIVLKMCIMLRVKKQ